MWKKADDALERFRSHGAFVVDNGEVELWLPELGITGLGAVWDETSLERLGSDPDSTEYARLQLGNVWGFIRSISTWMNTAQGF